MPSFGVPSLGRSARSQRQRSSAILPRPLREPSRGALEFFTKPIAVPHQFHTYTELQQQIHYDLPRCTRDVISQRPPFLLTHVKQLAVIIAALTFLFGLWFGVSTYHAPRLSYPYYNTQKPVPPWSEPTLLEGNRDRGGEYR